VSKLLTALALLMTLAQASGALALADVDFCATACAGETREQGCPPSADCCACCATAPSTTIDRPAVRRLDERTRALPSARLERLPLPTVADVFHVPLRAAA
jgi:hypothetical protein